jgi:hypothetical protein
LFADQLSTKSLSLSPSPSLSTLQSSSTKSRLI